MRRNHGTCRETKSTVSTNRRRRTPPANRRVRSFVGAPDPFGRSECRLHRSGRRAFRKSCNDNGDLEAMATQEQEAKLYVKFAGALMVVMIGIGILGMVGVIR